MIYGQFTVNTGIPPLRNQIMAKTFSFPGDQRYITVRNLRRRQNRRRCFFFYIDYFLKVVDEYRLENGLLQGLRASLARISLVSLYDLIAYCFA